MIQYVGSWSSDRVDPREIGAEQLECWAEGARRVMDFRKRLGGNRFVDVSFVDPNSDPIGTLEAGYRRLGLKFTEEAHRRVLEWADGHRPGSRGEHAYDLADYGLKREQVQESFADYLATCDATA